MMDILLTPEWIRETGINAEAEWQKRGQHDGGHSHADFLAEFAARAVLRKVVKAWDERRCSTSEESPCPYVGYDQAYCIACKAEAIVQALREAAGGEE